MDKSQPHVRRKTWLIVVGAVIVGVLAIGSLVYWKRFDVALWYMHGNNKAKETAIVMMEAIAKPTIEKDVKMTLLQKVFGTIERKRDEGERQADAVKDVRKFAEMGFEKHWLTFRDVHNLASVDGFSLHGYDFALWWNKGNRDEVLAAFNISYLKREMSNKQINRACSFFTDMKLYVEKRAKEN